MFFSRDFSDLRFAIFLVLVGGVILGITATKHYFGIASLQACDIYYVMGGLALAAGAKNIFAIVRDAYNFEEEYFEED